LAGVGLAARCTGELGTILGGELGMEGAVVKMLAMFGVAADGAVIVVVVVVETVVFSVEVDEEMRLFLYYVR
jgi:hypothetical protein